MAEISVLLYNPILNKSIIKVAFAENAYKAVEKSLLNVDKGYLVKDVNYIERDFERFEFHQSFSDCLNFISFARKAEESGFDLTAYTDNQIIDLYKTGVNV